MAQLTPLYTAPLPPGFQSGTVEIKSKNVYVDAAGRVNQAYYKATLHADGTLTDVQTGAPLSIVGMAQADPATAGLVEVVVNQDVAGLPQPLRSTFHVVPTDTGGGTLDLHMPDINVPVIGPLPATLQALTDQAHGVIQQAQAQAQAAAEAQDLVLAAVDVAGVTLSLVPQAIAEVQAQGATAFALASVAALGADSAAAVASNAAGLIPWKWGDHTTLPAAAGDYRIINGPEASQIWQRVTDGADPIRRADMEAISKTALMNQIRVRLVSDFRLKTGSDAGDTIHHDGRSYFWVPDSAEDDNGVTVLAPSAGVGRWIMADREWGVNLLWFKDLVVNGDWTPAMNAALSLDNVYIPGLTFDFKPTATNFIKLPVGKPRVISGSGVASVIRVMNGTGNYQRLFGSANDSQPLTDVRLSNFRIDQNADNNAGTVATSAGAAQSAIGFYNFIGVLLSLLTITIATGVNTISLNGVGCRNARVLDCDITWGNKGSTPAAYDNSSIYINCEDHEVAGCTIRARSINEGATGGIETHGAVGIVRDNRIFDFHDMINVVPFSSGVAELLTSSQRITGNIGIRCAIGIRLWPITGKVMRNVEVDHNQVFVAQSNFPTFLAPVGIYMNFSTNGQQNGDIDGLYIHHNLVVFEGTEARNNLVYNSMAGIGLASNGNIYNAYVHHNVVRNAPLSSYVYGRATKVVSHLRAFDNQAINGGTAINQPQSSLRVAVNVQGQHTDTYIRGLQFIEDTTSPQATALAVFFLTSGVPSNVRFESVDISAPNNPSIVIPSNPPAGVTFASYVSTSVSNTFTKLQTITVTGSNALNLTSDTGYALLAQSTSGVAAFGKSTSGYGMHGVSLSNNAVVAQQTGTATALLNAATLYVTRSTAAGANNVTAPLVRLEDNATVAGGTRFNDILVAYWDSVIKFQISGGSHAMGAGIITTGGWARASATLDFPSIPAQGQAELTITATGAAAGDTVELGRPAGLEAGLIVTARVSSTGIVTVRCSNNSAAAIDPASATYAVKVFK